MTLPVPTQESPFGWSDSSASRELWAAAAVRETFKADELLTGWLDRHADSTKSDLRDAMRAIVELQGIGIEAQDSAGAPALRLPPSARHSVLARIGVEGSLRALAGVAEERRTLAERTLVDLLAQKTVNADRDDGLQLRALKVATEWAAAAGIEQQDTSSDLEQRLQRNEFLQLLGGKDLFRFVGRAAVRRSLTQAWRKTEGVKWFYIEGPGGIGKSLAVARFIADLLEGEDPPDAVFHLDYDRLALQVAREVTVLQELIKQSARWCEPERLDELRDLSLELASRGNNLESVQLTSRSAEAYGLSRVVRRLPSLWRRTDAAQAGSRANADANRRRIVVFVDSFEQVDGFDSSAASSPRRALDRFRGQGVDVLAICASRAFGEWPRRDPMASIRLTQFSVREADTYLRNEASRVGLEVTPAVLREIRNAVGRSPLALRLAVNLLEQSGGRMEPGEWATAARESPELVQAALYDRLLRRIRDPELRKLAVPGLLVRRLTSEVITEVLAAPCELALGDHGADTLMSAAQREGQLFKSDPSDPGALHHRQDVRATMLTNIERSVDPVVVRAINVAAVDFYRRQSATGTPARIEELYHRLRLDQDETELDPRWIEVAGKLLRPAILEFPPRARAYVRRQLGAASASDAMPSELSAARVGYGPVDVEEQEFRLYATKELQSGASSDSILSRWRAQGSRLDVPLGDVFASALLSSGLHDELLTLSRDMMVARPTQVPPKVRSAVLSIAAGLLEGRDAFGDAQSHWTQALAAAREAKDAISQLVGLVGCVRIRRKRKVGATARAREIRSALKILPSMWKALYEQHVLAREVAAEFGEVLQQPNHRAAPDLQRLIGYLAEANELLPSAISDPARVEYLSEALLGSRGGVQDLRSLSSIVHKMVYDGPEVVERLIDVLRGEVDWVLRRAAQGRVRGNLRLSASTD